MIRRIFNDITWFFIFYIQCFYILTVYRLPIHHSRMFVMCNFHYINCFLVSWPPWLCLSYKMHVRCAMYAKLILVYFKKTLNACTMLISVLPGSPSLPLLTQGSRTSKPDADKHLLPTVAYSQFPIWTISMSFDLTYLITSRNSPPANFKHVNCTYLPFIIKHNNQVKFQVNLKFWFSLQLLKQQKVFSYSPGSDYLFFNILLMTWTTCTVWQDLFTTKHTWQSQKYSLRQHTILQTFPACFCRV